MVHYCGIDRPVQLGSPPGHVLPGDVSYFVTRRYDATKVSNDCVLRRRFLRRDGGVCSVGEVAAVKYAQIQFTAFVCKRHRCW